MQFISFFNFSIQRSQAQSHISLQAIIFLPFLSTPSLSLPRYVCKAQFLSANLDFSAKRKGKANKLKEHPPSENINTSTADIYGSFRLLVSVRSQNTEPSWRVSEMTNPERSAHFPVLWASCQGLQPHRSQMWTSDLQVSHQLGNFHSCGNFPQVNILWLQTTFCF